jgi:hypothetical protein
MNILTCVQHGLFMAHLKLCPECGVAGVAEAHEGKPTKKRKKAKAVEIETLTPLSGKVSKAAYQYRNGHCVWRLLIGKETILEATLEATIDYQMRKWK